jgi:phosphoribosylanthranilate isomerase
MDTPMPTRIKNCGLKTPEAVDCAITTGAGFAGFVHHASSPRHLSIEQMASLRSHAGSLIKTVAVLVNPSDELLGTIAREVKPDYFQLHDARDTGRIQAIQAQFSIPIISAISVKSESDLTNIATLEEISAHLLFDAPSSGSGKAFDWRLLKNLPLKKRWFLAGGLNAGNVAEAIRITGAPMIDVSSGIESSAGEKSQELIATFNAAVLQARP